jgi:DNA-binding NtrC family response regulator
MIDDDAVFLKAISRALHAEHPDLFIATASSAEQDLRLLGLRWFDAIITDFRMAGLTGLDLLKECQADGPDIPLILRLRNTRAEDDAMDQGLARSFKNLWSLNNFIT